MSGFLGLSDFFQFDFLIYALFGTIFLSIICGILSPLVVAKKYAFIGEGVAHSTLLGLSIALSFFYIEQSLLIFVTTLLITTLMVTVLAHATYRQRLPSDSMIGIYLTSTLAGGILIHQLFAKTKGDLLGLLFGNILLLEASDIALLFGLLIVVLLIIYPLRRKWIFFAYDQEGAAVSGIKTRFFHYLFLILLTMLIVSSLKIAGTVLVTSLLIIPGSFAYKFSKNMREVFLISITFSLLSSIAGLIIANWQGLPPGATLALTQFISLIVILFIRNKLVPKL